jgi:ATP-dependent exoDNAse (exonuclease V) beta subunit
MKEKTISEFLAENSRKKFAADRGTEIHRQLQFLKLEDDLDSGIAEKIKLNPEIARFWGAGSRAEVPIAGFACGRFHSKRIDRLIISGECIDFLDYKTDAARTRREDYEKTMRIYAQLLRAANPSAAVRGYILWLRDFELERIV